MQRRLKVDEKAQHTGVCELFEAALRHIASGLQLDLEQVLIGLWCVINPANNQVLDKGNSLKQPLRLLVKKQS